MMSKLLNIATGLGAMLMVGCSPNTTTQKSDQPQRAASKPNIVLIVLDDVGFSDLGAYGSEIRTPNIDGLAREGLKYNRFDTKAICSATRAALLTGRNNQTVRIENITSTRKEPDLNDDTSRRGEMPPNVPAAGAQAIGLQNRRARQMAPGP